ncbi:MAG: hypothetical protein JW945_07715, partial [Methanomicrobia archaeon]|nr:hypothetical protein [Methanomicrobia archaeon]
MRKRTTSFGMKRTLIFFILLVVGVAALPAITSALSGDSYGGTINEGQQEIIWQGDVTLTNGTTITV